MENASTVARSAEVEASVRSGQRKAVQGAWLWRCQHLSRMGGSAACARSLAVEVPASVRMGGSAVSARSLAVEVPASVTMGGSAVRARSLAVEVPASVPWAAAQCVQGAWLWRCQHLSLWADSQ